MCTHGQEHGNECGTGAACMHRACTKDPSGKAADATAWERAHLGGSIHARPSQRLFNHVYLRNTMKQHCKADVTSIRLQCKRPLNHVYLQNLSKQQ